MKKLSTIITIVSILCLASLVYSHYKLYMLGYADGKVDGYVEAFNDLEKRHRVIQDEIDYISKKMEDIKLLNSYGFIESEADSGR